MIGIIDYGAGNLDSVKKAFVHAGADTVIAESPARLARVKGIVLPGVGSYGQAVRNLSSSGMDRAILEWLDKGRSFLGICLGMQLLFDSSEEDRTCKGLGFFKGTCRRFKAKKVPQIGWNQVKVVRRSRLLMESTREVYFYFLHSYYVVPGDRRIIAATTDYSLDYASIIECGNICAVQFHPEKSGRGGIDFLKNWAAK